VAFPKLNLASWYIFVIGGLMTLYVAATGGVDNGLDLLRALQLDLLEHEGRRVGDHGVHHGLLVDPDRGSTSSSRSTRCARRG
jgi:hypothetical protein